MNGETEILIYKAAAGELDPAEQALWDRLCAEDPGLREEAAELARMLQRMDQTAVAVEAQALAQPPAEVPPYILAQLETTRREIAPVEREGFWSRLSKKMTQGRFVAAPLLAATAVVVGIAAVLWPRPHGGQDPTLGAGHGSGGPVVMKGEINAALPVNSPGKRCSFIDPDILWVSLDRAPVTIEILDEKGAALIRMDSVTKTPLTWGELSAGKPGLLLSPGSAYLVRLTQGDKVSSRRVEILPEAVAIEATLAKEDATGSAAKLLEAGQPADALALANRLVTRSKEKGEAIPEALAKLREAAWSATVAAGE